MSAGEDSTLIELFERLTAQAGLTAGAYVAAMRGTGSVDDIGARLDPMLSSIKAIAQRHRDDLAAKQWRQVSEPAPVGVPLWGCAGFSTVHRCELRKGDDLAGLGYSHWMLREPTPAPPVTP